jgi:VanZ family protein
MLHALTSLLLDSPRSTSGWRIALLFLLAVITWLALSPAPPPQADLGWDKLNHLTAFATLAVVAVLGRIGSFWRVGGALLAYGGSIEVLQTFIPNRAGEWADLLADGVGMALGLLLVAALRRLAARAGAAAGRHRA